LNGKSSAVFLPSESGGHGLEAPAEAMRERASGSEYFLSDK